MELTLTKLPWYAQIGVFTALAVGAVGAFYWYYERPMRDEMTAREQQLTGLRSDIAKGLETAKKLPQFQAEVAELETRLSSLRAVLPDEKDAADLLRRMQSVAVQSNLTITSFKPEPVVTKQLHVEWPIQLELDGSYHNLALFFDRVGKFTRIVNISGLEVEGKTRPTANGTITAKCVATTFVLLDSPPAAEPPAAPAANARPRTPARGTPRRGAPGRGAPARGRPAA